MKHSFFEKFYNWKYDCDINDELKDIQKIADYDTDTFSQWQNDAKWDIAAHHYKHNSFYRSVVGEIFPTVWEELPIMTRDVFQKKFDSTIMNKSHKNNLYVNRTSGTTGQPLQFVKDYKTQGRVWAAKKRFFNLHGVTIGSKEARIYAMPTEYKNILIEKIKDRILNRVRFNVFDMSESTFEQWLKMFSKQHFEYVYGFTSAIVLFSRYLIREDLVLKNICPSLKLCIVTSEVCTQEDKQIIQRAFGVKIVIEYGSKDVGLIGYECALGNMHIPEENIYVESNDKGEILVTDLSNKAFPFVRYLLGDKVSVSDEKCQCGSNNRVIRSLDGRSNELILLPDNRSVPSLIFLIIMRSELERLGELKEFVVRQDDFDSFTLDIVTDKVLSELEEKRLKDTAENYLQTKINLTINQVEKIEREPSGKIKFFCSAMV